MNWYYYDKNGEKIAVTGKQLKEFAQQGIITPETVVETGEGKTSQAGSVKGLVFAKTKQSEVVKPIGTEIYGLTSPAFSSPVGGVNSPVLTSEGQRPSDYAPLAMKAAGNSNTVITKPSVIPRPAERKPVIWDWLFLDFRFRFFVTPLLIKVIWCMWVAVVELLIVMTILGILFAIFSSILPDISSGGGASSDWPGASRRGGLPFNFLLMIMQIIFVPIIIATFLLCIRIVLEGVMIIFRIGEHLKNIDEKTFAENNEQPA